MLFCVFIIYDNFGSDGVVDILRYNWQNENFLVDDCFYLKVLNEMEEIVVNCGYVFLNI